jgi:hypothetical protein
VIIRINNSGIKIKLEIKLKNLEVKNNKNNTLTKSQVIMKED